MIRQQDYNKMMDEGKFLQLIQRLDQLSNQYTTGQIKHMQYAQEYDKTLEAYNITKKLLVAEIDRRLDPKYQPGTVTPLDKRKVPQKRAV